MASTKFSLWIYHMNYKMFLLILIICASLQAVFSCICMPMHPQKQYCRAQYVISGRIVSSTWKQIDEHFNNSDAFDGQLPEDVAWGNELVQVQKNFSIPRFELHNWEMEYAVKVQQVFKTSADYPIATGQVLLLRSRPKHGHLCGISLQDKKNYVLGGPVPGHINLCDWAQIYNTVTRRQKQGLRRGYQKQCDTCEVFSCDPEFCNPPSSNKVCVYAGLMHSEDALEWDESDCIARHSRCQQKGKKGRCRWQNNGEMTQCQSRYGIQDWFTFRNF
ncbi:metalloproteinase inhibitor 2-like [Amphiura filiformis]|uniref:metalloproteinase inhibitor 2-like n=1 Tax=Amphiura filiformis TaxID=82378 RepID=UPI003B218A7F